MGKIVTQRIAMGAVLAASWLLVGGTSPAVLHFHRASKSVLPGTLLEEICKDDVSTSDCVENFHEAAKCGRGTSTTTASASFWCIPAMTGAVRRETGTCCTNGRETTGSHFTRTKVMTDGR